MKPQSDVRMPSHNQQRFGQPCPKCNDILLAPAMSEHVNENLVRHVWLCDSCGHQFQTSVVLLSHRKRQAATT
jgi:transcription elongation factor Elf1